jgi:c-di-GMP-binding flagellar brake protein YcgR
MDHRKHAVGQECRSILEAAVIKRLPIKITLNKDNSWQVYKSNILAVQANRLILSQPTPDTTECQMEPAAGQQVAVTFKKGYNKCLFITRVIGADRLEIDPGVFMPVLVVFRPDYIERIQRRAYDRVSVDSDEPITVDIRQAGSNGTNSRESWKGVLMDLSAGGVGLEMDSGLRSSMTEGEQYKLEFVPLVGQEPLQLHVRLRHITDHPEKKNRCTLGFQTIGLEMNEEGRKTLRRIGRIINVYKRRAPIDQHDELMRRL